MAERYRVAELHGWRINQRAGRRGTGPHPPGVCVVVLDALDCYRICGEFHSEDRGGYRGRTGARRAGDELAARLEQEHRASL